MPRAAIDIAGLVFGRVTVLSRQGLRSDAAAWLCRCSCGKTFNALGSNLRKGDTRSCGCLRSEITSARSIKHGLLTYKSRNNASASRTYRIWSNMLSRCRNKNLVTWPDYGGRGIYVCDSWKLFQNFLSDMGEAPPGLTLDRVDNDKGYEPKNCRWATYSEQNKNRRPFGQGYRSRRS